jgi:hypothetical protein
MNIKGKKVLLEAILVFQEEPLLGQETGRNYKG